MRSVFQKFIVIDKVVIFGSRAKGNFRPGSDIDLAIFSLNMTYLELMNLENEIDDLLMPYSVDIVHFDKLTNPELIDHIKRVGVQLYARE